MMQIYSLVISGVIFLTAAIWFIVLNYSYDTASIKKSLLFIALFALIITLPAITIYFIPEVSSSILWMAGFSVYFMGLGIGSYFLLKHEIFGELKNPDTSNILLSIVFASLGYLGFVLLFNYFDVYKLGPVFGIGILLFIVPQIFMVSFEILASMPQEIFKVWYYPVDEDLPDLEKEDLNLILSIEIEFHRNPAINEPPITYKAKAPVSMLYREWFMYFVYKYNEKFDDNQLKVTDENNNVYGWVFYPKPSFWSSKKYIDFDISIRDNKVVDNQIIVAKRVKVS